MAIVHIAGLARYDALYIRPSGVIRIYSGTVPATAQAALTSQVLLAEFEWSGRLTTTAQPWTLTYNTGRIRDIVASGTATFYRMFYPSTTVLAQGICGGPSSGADMILDNPSLVSGRELEILSEGFTIATTPANTSKYAQAEGQVSANASGGSATGLVAADRVFVVRLYDVNTLLAEIVSNDALPSTSSGIANLTAKFPATTPVIAVGTANRFEVLRNGIPFLEGSIGISGSGADMILGDTALAIGDTISVSNFRFLWT